METYEQNDAALHTYLMDQRQSLRNFDDIQDSYRDQMGYPGEVDYELLRRSSFVPSRHADGGSLDGQEPQMDDLIAQNFAKLMQANH